MATLPGLQRQAAIAADSLGLALGLGSFDHVAPVVLGAAMLGGFAVATWVTMRAGAVVRRVPTWGGGGGLTARTEYTATAFSKPLMMIFRAVYRPTREVEALAGDSPYFPREVRYRAAIEPTFERYLYGPLLRAVLRVGSEERGVGKECRSRWFA